MSACGHAGTMPMSHFYLLTQSGHERTKIAVTQTGTVLSVLICVSSQPKAFTKRREFIIAIAGVAA
jgi:hypothetical protein